MMTQQEYINRFTEVCRTMIGLTERKNSDYAGQDNAFRNFELIERLSAGRITTADGIVVRLTDKLQRVTNLLSREAQVADEKITDTLMDMAVYAIILYIYLSGKEAAQLPTAPVPQTAEEARNAVLLEAAQVGAANLSPAKRAYLEMLMKMQEAA